MEPINFSFEIVPYSNIEYIKRSMGNSHKFVVVLATTPHRLLVVNPVPAKPMLVQASC